MPAFLLLNTDECAESERQESFDLAKKQIIARCPDVLWYKEDAETLAFGTQSSDLLTSHLPYLMSFQRTLPWINVQKITMEAPVPENEPDFSVVESFVSHRDWCSIDWISGEIDDYEKRFPKFTTITEAPNDFERPMKEFLFPSSVTAKMGGYDCIAYPFYTHSDTRISFNSLSEMQYSFLAFYCYKSFWIRSAKLLDAFFAYKNALGFSPFEYLMKDQFVHNDAFPQIYRNEDMLNGLGVWYPAAKHYAKTPETLIFPVPSNFNTLLDAKKPLCFKSYIAHMAKEVEKAGWKYPIFLRTDQTSNKHSFEDTCKVNSPKDFASHISLLVDFSGCVDLTFTSFVARKWIDGPEAWVEERFGNMPVRKEFRFFVENGKVSHIQPYWPEKAFEHCTLSDEQKAKLVELTYLSKDDREYLANLSCTIVKNLNGDWSVDWLAGSDGWYLTDMAVASQSYRYDPPSEWKKNYGD